MGNCEICGDHAYVNTSHGEFCRPCALKMISQSLRDRQQAEADEKAKDTLADVIDMAKYRKNKMSFKERYNKEAHVDPSLLHSLVHVVRQIGHDIDPMQQTSTVNPKTLHNIETYPTSYPSIDQLKAQQYIDSHTQEHPNWPAIAVETALSIPLVKKFHNLLNKGSENSSEAPERKVPNSERLDALGEAARKRNL